MVQLKDGRCTTVTMHLTQQTLCVLSGHCLGQFSNVTNAMGIEYLQAHIPEGYSVNMLEMNDPNALHLDAAITPLRDGLLVYHPEQVTEAVLGKQKVLEIWDLRPFPFAPQFTNNRHYLRRQLGS